jgi:hypothetical protein
VTIRAKLYLAIALTVLGPLATIAVALHGQNTLDDRFAEVQERAAHRALALELKFGMTDVNGWQTVWGYDDGASRPIFESSVADFRRDLREANERLTEPRERQLLREFEAGFADFMRLDERSWEALQDGRKEVTKRILLGPELEIFEQTAGTAERLAAYETQQAGATEAAFDDAQDDVRRRLIAVALGAAVVIVLLLLTASDLARLALEGERQRRAPQAS